MAKGREAVNTALQGRARTSATPSSSVFISSLPSQEKGLAGFLREKTELPSRKGQMEQGICSWRDAAGPVGMQLSQQRPLLPMQAQPRPGKLWEYHSVYLLEPRKATGPRLLPLSGWQGTRSNSAFHLGSGLGAVCVPQGSLHELS